MHCEVRETSTTKSIGGMVAQEITLQAPDLVRKLILWVRVRVAVREWRH